MADDKEYKREYDKQYKLRNQDKIKEQRKIYKETHREELKLKSKTYYDKNKQILAQKSKAYRNSLTEEQKKKNMKKVKNNLI